jgi:Ca2+-binding EF-hand superfamily protein
MEDILRIYKNELLERIGLKKTINKTNEQIILDNFKYFDLNGNNYCNLNEFIRANERLGIEMRKKDDLVKIFHYFTIQIIII